MTEEKALVISGGGSKGAFGVGVLLSLHEHPGRTGFTHFVGTSTGALITPFALLGEYRLLEQLYTNVTNKDILNKFNILERLQQASLFDGTPLWKLIEQYYTDATCERLLSSDLRLYLTATCLQTERLTVFTNHPHPKSSPHYDIQRLRDPAHLRKAILASASQPVFMAPVKVNLHVEGALFPNHQFVDGGVLEYAGIQMAIDQGATEILTILHSAQDTSVTDQEFNSIFSILQQTIGIFMGDVGKNDLIIPFAYNEALTYIERVKEKMLQAGITHETIEEYFRINGKAGPYQGKKPLSIHVIRPAEPLGGGTGGLDFNPDEMKNMMQAGRIAGTEFLERMDRNRTKQ